MWLNSILYGPNIKGLLILTLCIEGIFVAKVVEIFKYIHTFSHLQHCCFCFKVLETKIQKKKMYIITFLAKLVITLTPSPPTTTIITPTNNNRKSNNNNIQLNNKNLCETNKQKQKLKAATAANDHDNHVDALKPLTKIAKTTKNL